MSKSSDNNSIKMVETDNQRNDDRDRDTDSGSCVANTGLFLTFHSLCILSNVRRNRTQIKTKYLNCQETSGPNCGAKHYCNLQRLLSLAMSVFNCNLY